MKTRCPYDSCSKTLSSKFNLQRHIDTCHLHIKRFECAVCFKLFASKQNLHEHQYIHGEEAAEISQVPKLTGLREEIEVPKLTVLLTYSHDPLFKPYLHVNRVYPYPVIWEEVQLAPIGEEESPELLPRLETLGKF